MRATRGPTWRAALLSVVTLLSVSIAVLGRPNPVHADPGCQSGGVYVLFVRGSGAPIWSSEAQQFKGNIFGALGDVGITTRDWAELGNLDNSVGPNDNPDESNEYPATWAGWTVINRSQYDASVTIGTDELVRHLNQRYGSGPGDRNCSNETVVLGGYSQGADVIGWALERNGGGGYVTLSAAARNHIGAVASYGDPTFSVACGQDRWWVRANARCDSIPRLEVRNPYAPSSLRGRLFSWCDDGDGVCAWHGGMYGIGNHTTAYSQYWIWQSRQEIAKAASNRLGLLNPAQGTGVGAAAYRGSDALTINQPMYKNQYVMSQGGNFVLVFQSDGNLVLYGHRYQPLWSSGTSGQNVSHVVLQPDGNWVMYSPGGQPVWHIVTSAGASHVVVQPDGNLVQYNTGGQAVWHTNTGRAVAPLVYVGQDHLSVNQYLTHNQYIRSTDGTRFLHLQADGNLVLYGPGHHLLWHSGTGGTGATHVVMQPDGNFVLYGPTGQPLWFTNQSAGASHVVVQPDGNLAQYNTSGHPVWWSGTAGQI